AGIEDEEMLEQLVEAALAPMLAAGRHSTIEKWIGSRTSSRTSILLAEAELASRRGDQRRAEALAVQAARQTKTGPLAVRAWNLAGPSAHMADRYTDAIDFHRRAEAQASDPSERRDALWGLLVASWQADPAQVPGL